MSVEEGKWPHIGAILIGGTSSRMGRPKHELILADGRAMIDHVIHALGEACARVVIVGGNLPGHESISDLRTGMGPLGGIETLLASNIDAAGQYLVCPCDVPLMSPATLRLLLKPTSALATIVRVEGRTEPEWLPARVSAAALPVVRRLLDTGRRAIWNLMEALPAEIVPIAAEWSRCFINVNAQKDLKQLR